MRQRNLRAMAGASAALLVTIAALGAGSGAGGGPIETTPLPSVHEKSLRAHVEFLAARALEGRRVGQNGLDVAAQYIASALQQTNVEPWRGPAGAAAAGGLDRYLQPFTLAEETSEARLALHPAGPNEAEPLPERDFGVALPIDVVLDPLPVSFVGFGIQDAERGYDDLAGVALEGRVALMLNNPRSRNAAGDFFLDPKNAARYFTPQNEVKRLLQVKNAGARAILVVRDPWGLEPADAADPEPLRTRRRLRLAGTTRPDEQVRTVLGIPTLNISVGLADRLLRASGLQMQTLASRLHTEGRPSSRALDEVRISLSLRSSERPVPAANVLGYIPGTDRGPAAEPVILGAHYDHLGRNGDQVWAGADDNASGVAAILEVARILANGRQPPRRSIVLGFWSAEEQGLLGSQFFLTAARADGARIGTAVNLDMVGRIPRMPAGGEAAPVLNVAATPRLPLAELLGRLPSGHGLQLRTDARPLMSIRSDNVTFAAAGIDTVALHHGWDHPDYHKPTDTADKIDYGYLSRVAQVTASLVRMLSE